VTAALFASVLASVPRPPTDSSAEQGERVPDKSPQQIIQELRDLVVAYFRQETLEPLQGIGRYVGFGIAGALLLGTGVLFLAIGGLRALQTETGTPFTGNWSWVPYAIVVAGLVVLAGLAWVARSRRGAKAPRSTP
jgi:Putative Actinobacterial Holin-X, holin superfamily III